MAGGRRRHTLRTYERSIGKLLSEERERAKAPLPRSARHTVNFASGSTRRTKLCLAPKLPKTPTPPEGFSRTPSLRLMPCESKTWFSQSVGC